MPLWPRGHGDSLCGARPFLQVFASWIIQQQASVVCFRFLFCPFSLVWQYLLDAHKPGSMWTLGSQSSATVM